MVTEQEAVDRRWNMRKSNEIREKAFFNAREAKHWIRCAELLQSLQFWRCSEWIRLETAHSTWTWFEQGTRVDDPGNCFHQK